MFRCTNQLMMLAPFISKTTASRAGSLPVRNRQSLCADFPPIVPAPSRELCANNRDLASRQLSPILRSRI